MSISVHANGVATFWDEGQKYATVSGQGSSGYLSIGMNCVKGMYQNLVVQNSAW